MRIFLTIAALAGLTTAALAQSDMTPKVVAADQSLANGVVSADSVTAMENGWLVVHRTDAEMKPGPVVGHAPLRVGTTNDVAAILTEEVAPRRHAHADGAQRGTAA